MTKPIYELVKEFKKKYPMTVAWRLKKHAKIIEKHLTPNEEILYVFAGQKSHNVYEIFFTNIVVLTNKRIIVATKRVFFGYIFLSVTPELYNDLRVKARVIWGKVLIDTVKELIEISNIDKRALKDIQIKISEFMRLKKKDYPVNRNSIESDL